jgi:hypothetical protein
MTTAKPSYKGQALYLKSGDMVSFMSASNKYSDGTAHQYYVATRNDKTTSVFSFCATDYCLASGICHNGGNSSNISTAYTPSQVPTYSSQTVFTVFSFAGTTENGSSFASGNSNYRYEPKPNGTPIRLGDYISFLSTIDGATYAWQTGDATITGTNDAINLSKVNHISYSSSGASGYIDTEYQIFTVVSSTDDTGLFDTKNEEQILDPQAVYYGNPYWFQSVGKALSNNNYQFITLNNTKYDCEVSTQDVDKTPDPKDYNTMFVFLNGQGKIPLIDGKTADPPKSGDAATNGILGIRGYISDIIFIVVLSIVVIIFTIIIGVIYHFFG